MTRPDAAVDGDSPVARVVSVNLSPGGKPKIPVTRARLDVGGFEGDGREHSKHYKPDRAVSLVDMEALQGMGAKGSDGGPGEFGENLTVHGLDVRLLSPGTRLRLSGGTEIELTEPHRPCSVPDGSEPRVIGCFARVVVPGDVTAGEAITVVEQS